MKIRRAHNSDNLQIAELICCIFEQEFPRDSSAFGCGDLENIEESYGGSREAFFVMEENSVVVGTVAVKEDDQDTALLRRMFLAQQYRGKGYGSELLKQALTFAKQCDYKRIVFRGTSAMKGALQLCERNGFKREDAIFLGRSSLLVYAKKV